jgi:hypothetical protein
MSLGIPSLALSLAIVTLCRVVFGAPARERRMAISLVNPGSNRFEKSGPFSSDWKNHNELRIFPDEGLNVHDIQGVCVGRKINVETATGTDVVLLEKGLLVDTYVLLCRYAKRVSCMSSG